MEKINSIEENFRTVELNNGKRVTFEYYNNAKGGQIVAGSQYINEQKVEKMKNILNIEVIDW